MEIKTTLKCKNFILRPIKISDAKPYYQTMCDKDTRANMESFPSSIEEAKKEIKEYLKQIKNKDSEYFTIEIKGKYAGNVVLQHQNWDPKSNEGRVHLWIHPSFRGKGLATDALEKVINYAFQKKYNKIFAQCKSINKGVIKINKKLGFKIVKKYTNENGVKKILFVKNKIGGKTKKQ